MQACCRGRRLWHELSSGPESHPVDTANNRPSMPLASGEGERTTVYREFKYMFVLYMRAYDFPECARDIFLCVFNMGVTVDTVLLRRRLGVLLWADIRASMSSSASSSENSCGRQRSDLIKRRRWYLGGRPRHPCTVAQFSTQQLCVCVCVCVCVGGCSQLSINSIRQVRTECGNLFTRFSHAESQCHRVYSTLVSVNGWADLKYSACLRFCKAPWMQMGAPRQSSPYTDHQILHLLSAYNCLDACHALWSELWSEINIQPTRHAEFVCPQMLSSTWTRSTVDVWIKSGDEWTAKNQTASLWLRSARNFATEVKCVELKVTGWWRLLFRWARGPSGFWGWERPHWVQNRALTGPSLSDCDLVRGRERERDGGKKKSSFKNAVWRERKTGRQTQRKRSR